MTNIPKEWVCLPTSNHAHHYVLELKNAQMPFNGNDEARAYAKVLTAAPKLLASLKEILHQFAPTQGALGIERDAIRRAEVAIKEATQ